MKFNMLRKAQFARRLSGVRWGNTIRIKFPIKQPILIYIAQVARFVFVPGNEQKRRRISKDSPLKQRTSSARLG